MTELEILAKNVKRYRQAKGLTQEELSKKVTLTKDSISLIELGRRRNPSLENLISISQELDIELFQLFLEDPDMLIIKLVASDQNLRSFEKISDEVFKRLDNKKGINIYILK